MNRKGFPSLNNKWGYKGGESRLGKRLFGFEALKVIRCCRPYYDPYRSPPLVIEARGLGGSFLEHYIYGVKNRVRSFYGFLGFNILAVFLRSIIKASLYGTTDVVLQTSQHLPSFKGWALCPLVQKGFLVTGCSWISIVPPQRQQISGWSTGVGFDWGLVGFINSPCK